MTFQPYYDDGTVTIYHGEVEDLALDDLGGCCAAVVTSPPYNVGLGYADDPTGDALGWEAYGDLTTAAVEAISWALVPGGRAWVNTAVSVPLAIGGEGRKRRVLLGTWWANALAAGGLELVDQVAWTSVRGPGTAWGSWQSPSSPNLRGDYEVVTVACKDGWERQAPAGAVGWRDTAGGWESLCSTVWNVPTVGANGGRKAHPAPFPVELARRCIRLSTWPGEDVFDPFCGTGSTLVAAAQLGRRAVGIERSEKYCELAATRLAQGALDFGGAA